MIGCRQERWTAKIRNGNPTVQDQMDQYNKVGGSSNFLSHAAKDKAVVDNPGNDDDDDNDDDGHDGGNDGDQPAAQEHVQTPSVNATEVIADEDDNDEGVVDSANQETRDAAQQDDEQDAVRQVADDVDEDDKEDNMPLSSKIEALRRGDAFDKEDDVVLSIKYQVPSQGLVTFDTDLEIVGENPAEMEVEVADNSLLVISDDGELYGIDDVDACIDIVVEKTVSDIFEDISDKVDMDLAEEVVKALEDKEAVDKKVASAKPQTYRRRKKAKKSKRKIVLSESDEEEVVVVVVETPQDDVVLTTSRETDGEAIGKKIVMYHAPFSASNQHSTYASSHGVTAVFVDMSSHIGQAVKCLLSAIEEQSSVMKVLLKHLEFYGFQNQKVKADMYLRLGDLIDQMNFVVTILRTVLNSLKIISPSVRTLTYSFLKKLNPISVENKDYNKIIENKIQITENFLKRKI
ncbi:hypothetical protein Dimus_028843 [Dionaea muscipula]